MSDEVIDTSKIPIFTGSLAGLETDAADLRTTAGSFRSTGSSVHRTFQGLSAVYSAPEDTQLFDTTKSVSDEADFFAGQLESVARALDAFVDEARPLVAKLQALHNEASLFVLDVAGDDDWREDKAKVATNNRLHAEVKATWLAHMAAERRCANKITALVPGGTHFRPDDGSHKSSMYGYRADDLQGVEMPWGAPVEVDEWWGVDVFKGVVVDGIGGTVEGLWVLSGFGGEDGETAAAWKGLGNVFSGLGQYAVWPFDAAIGFTMGEGASPDNEQKQAFRDFAKSLVAWDQWGENNPRAAGAAGFNLLSFAVPAGAAVKAGSTGKVASAASVVVRVGDVLDPVSLSAKGVGKAAQAARISDLFKGLRQMNGPSAAALRLSDGPTLPPGAVRFENEILYPDGSVYRDGKLLRAEDAQKELPAAQRRPGSEREPAMAALREENGTPAGGHTGSAAPETGTHARDLPADPGALRRGGGGSSGGGGLGGGAAPPPARGPGGGADEGLPYPGKDASREEIVRWQVDRVNRDPAWKETFYRKDGYRRDVENLRGLGKDKYGNQIPQIRWDEASHRWVAATNDPIQAHPKYLEKGIPGHPRTVSPEQAQHLENAAKARHDAIKADDAARKHLEDMERRFARDPSEHNRGRMHAAEADYKAKHTAMGQRSEDFGEAAAARHAVPDHYPGAERVADVPGPKNGNDRFDQIWKTPDGRYVVVEAKSQVKTSLGSRRVGGQRVSQGTLEYFQDILKEMETSAKRPEHRQLVKDLRSAKKTGRLDYVLVKGNPDGARYGGYEMSRFDVG
ncbi:hypothetical protein [Streptomyces cacaoi]|uniref:hypothetical protein n=1 Tax=Streptomyces cacaoi TaxID=1898 RepID=UPI003330646A